MSEKNKAGITNLRYTIEKTKYKRSKKWNFIIKSLELLGWVLLLALSISLVLLAKR